MQKNTDGFGGISSNEIKPPYRTIGTDEIISQDHTDVKEKPNKMYESRTAELTDEQVIEQRLKNLKETDPEFKKKKKYSDISSKMVSNVKERNNLSRKLEKANDRFKDRVNVKADYRQKLEDYISELQKKLTRLQSEYDSMKVERQELYKDSQIEKIIEAWS